MLEAWNGRHALRFNKGEEGRGADYFGTPQLNRLSRMLSHYPALASHRRELLEADLPRSSAASRAQ
jgi:hypothetical protein